MMDDDRLDLRIDLLRKEIRSLEEEKVILLKRGAQEEIIEDINTQISQLKRALKKLEQRQNVLKHLRQEAKKPLTRLEKPTGNSNSNGTGTIEAATVNRENQLYLMRWCLFGLASAFCLCSYATFFIWIWCNAEFLFSEGFSPLRYLLLAILLFVPTFVLYFVSCNVFRHHESSRDREKSILNILTSIKEFLKELIPLWKGK